MTSFGWKRKLCDKVSKEASSKFKGLGPTEDDDDDDDDDEDSPWDAFSKKRKVFLLEDAAGKSNRLKAEGEILAEAGRYWEAITKWNDALQYTPSNEHLLEMKAQVLLELREIFPAVEAAQRAIGCNPLWWVAHQTLGRAQLGLGEITMAVKSFSRAIHLNPAEPELWEADLRWACSLRNQQTEREKQQGRDCAIASGNSTSLKRTQLGTKADENPGLESTRISDAGNLSIEAPGVESNSVQSSATLASKGLDFESTSAHGLEKVTGEAPGAESTSKADSGQFTSGDPGSESTTSAALTGLTCCTVAAKRQDDSSQDEDTATDSKVCMSLAERQDKSESSCDAKHADAPIYTHCREGYR